MKKFICMLALAGIGYGTVYAAIPQQTPTTTKVTTKKKGTTVKVKKKTTRKVVSNKM